MSDVIFPARDDSSNVIRKADIMEVPKHFDLTHFRAITAVGRKFVYCPVGNICSWHPGDYNNKWCHFCGKFFSDITGVE